MPTTTDRLFSLAALVAAAIPGAPCPADGPVPMSRIAPRDAFVVAEIPDFTALHAAADQSGLGDLWRDPKVREFIEHVSTDALRELADQLERIDAKPEDLKPPTGRVGFAMFLPEGGGNADGEPGTFPTPVLMAVADFGENAEHTRDLIGREIDRAKAADEVEVREEEHDGIVITVIKDLAPAGEEAGDPGMADEPAEPEEYFLAWSGTNLAVTTGLEALKSALDALGGREVDSVDSNPVFERSLRQHASGPMGYAVMLIAPLAEEVKKSMRADAPPGFDPVAVLSELGLDEFQSISGCLRSLGGPESLAESTFAMLVPEKKGLVKLFLEPVGAFEPPAFVGPDASTVVSANFKFDGLIDTLRAAINVLPEDQRAQASAGFEQGAAMFGPALAQLGPRVHYFQSYDRPLSPEAQRQVFAVQVRDQLPVVNTLQAQVTMFLGLEPRDFEGNTIYSSEDGPFAIGIGFGHLFLGPTAGVENAMRAASNPEAPRLATEQRFRAATAGVSRDALMASYADLRQEIQWLYYTFQNFEAIQAATFEGLDLPPDEKEELLKHLRAQKPEWADHLPPIETLTSRLGFSVYDLRPTPEGFFGRSRLLKP